MRRAHAILVILALLATPMALLARSDCDRSGCDCMCDLVNRSLQAHAQARRGPMLCGQAATSIHQCAMKTRHRALDFGLNTLMAPTAPLPMADFAAPLASEQLLAPRTLLAPSGFFSAPYQPPRS